MAYAYRQQTRFCPVIKTGSVRFPQKIQSNVGCPAANGCSLGAVTNVNIDSNAVVTLSSSYIMKGMDCFQFTVSNVICNSTYTFRSMSTTSYPTGASASGQLSVVSVSPVVDTYICSTCNVTWTSIVPSAPFGVRTTTSNISWNTPITPENYGFPTITSFTIIGVYEFGPNTASPADGWKDSAMSATGQYQTAISENSYTVYRSSNYGRSWTYVDGLERIGCIAMSADGQYQTVADNFRVYYSQDYGSNWTNPGGGVVNFDQLSSIAISATGQYQTAVGGNGQIFLSSTYGSEWYDSTLTTTYSDIKSIAMSGDGRYQTATANDGNQTTMLVSKQFGYNWEQIGSFQTGAQNPVAVSSTGQYQTAGGRGLFYVSSNYGSNWSYRYPPIPSTDIYGLAMSADGQYQIAIDGFYQTFISSNAGTSWVGLTDYVPPPRFLKVAVSSDGTTYQTFASTEIGTYLWSKQPIIPQYSVTNPNLTLSGNIWNLSLASSGEKNTQISATNMAGTGPFSRPG